MNVNSVIQIVCLCVPFVCVSVVFWVYRNSRKNRKEAQEILEEADRRLKEAGAIYREAMVLTFGEK